MIRIARAFANLDYKSAASSVLIGSSSHFEVAIAVATTLFGLGSGAALATVIGPLMEIPLMISLTKLLWHTRNKFPRKKIPVPNEIARVKEKRYFTIK